MTTDIKKYDFKAGLSQEFEIFDIESMLEIKKKMLTSNHRTNFYHIIWFQQGNPTHLVDFNPIAIKPNTLLFLNKDIVQRFDRKTSFGGKVILFTDRFFCKTETDVAYLQNNILFNDLFTVSQIQINELTHLFAALLQQMTIELQHVKDHSQADILKNLLHNFLLHSERERRKQNFIEIKKDADLTYVMLFKTLLDTGYKTKKQVNFYAKEMIISEKRLNQATSKILGKTPKEIIDDRIILEAKRILSHTNQSIKEICYFLGFEEPTNFIKYFKKHSHFTPTEFRAKNNLA
jgi:AraC-like DNA-binding protein